MVCVYSSSKGMAPARSDDQPEVHAAAERDRCQEGLKSADSVLLNSGRWCRWTVRNTNIPGVTVVPLGR